MQFLIHSRHKYLGLPWADFRATYKYSTTLCSDSYAKFHANWITDVEIRAETHINC